MDINTYAVESQIEESHWWFVVRRKLFSRIIDKINLPRDAVVLDVGTSTGTNLRLLKELGFNNYTGLDMSEEAVKWCEEKKLGKVELGDVCNIPFPDNSFDLILATDIIEHVDNDLKALGELRRVLKDTGRILFTVPAFPSLWGLQDEVSHHKRRYLRSEFMQKLDRSGLNTVNDYYFNFILFVPIWIVRQIVRVGKINLSSENEINTPFINSLLKLIFSFDVKVASILKPPFGVSFLALAKRD